MIFIQNVRPLEGKDRDDVMEVLNAARKYVEAKSPELEFVQLRNGYRWANFLEFLKKKKLIFIKISNFSDRKYLFV